MTWAPGFNLFLQTNLKVSKISTFQSALFLGCSVCMGYNQKIALTSTNCAAVEGGSKGSCRGSAPRVCILDVSLRFNMTAIGNCISPLLSLYRHSFCYIDSELFYVNSPVSLIAGVLVCGHSTSPKILGCPVITWTIKAARLCGLFRWITADNTI